MSDNSNNTGSRFGAGSILVGIGAILIGLAGLMIAGQWETYPRISLESPPSPKVGFALVSEKIKAESTYGSAEYHYYLLDKDSGRIWIKNNFKESWQEVYVEGITPSDSPASSRK